MGPIELKGIAILASLCIGAFALVVQRHVKSWTHPSVLFSLFWFFLSFLPLIGVIWVPVHPAGLLYLLAAVVAFGLPSYLGDWNSPISSARSRQKLGHAFGTTTVVMFVGIQILTLLCLAMNLLIQGFSISAFIANPILEVDRYLVAKYAGTLVPNPFVQAGIILNYVGVAAGGLVVGSKLNSRNAGIVALAFAPALLNMVFYADKGTLFLSAAYFFGAVIVSRVRKGNLSLITPSTVKVGAFAIAALVPLIGFALYVRGSDAWEEAGDGARMLFYVNSYAFSHIYAFSDWFAHYSAGVPTSLSYSDPAFPTAGFWTFTPIVRYFMPDYRMPIGNFAEYYVHPGTMQSNIYTMFRGLIYDFSIAGSLAFMFLFGLLSSFCYQMMLQRPAHHAAEAYFIFLVGYIYSSFLISLTMWTSVFAAGVGVFLLLVASDFKQHPRSSASPQPYPGESPPP